MYDSTLPSTAIVRHRNRLGLGLVLLLSAFASAAGERVAFRGNVVGSVTTDPHLTPISSQSQMRATSVGRGPQVFRDIAIEPVLREGRLVLLTRGVAEVWAIDGSRLLIAFSLDAEFVSGPWLVYTGEFRVLPEGTGRFDFTGIDAPLGQGAISGKANLSPRDGGRTMVFSFQHEFLGDLFEKESGGRTPDPNRPPRAVGPTR